MEASGVYCCSIAILSLNVEELPTEFFSITDGLRDVHLEMINGIKMNLSQKKMKKLNCVEIMTSYSQFSKIIIPNPYLLRNMTFKLRFNGSWGFGTGTLVRIVR